MKKIISILFAFFVLFFLLFLKSTPAYAVEATVVGYGPQEGCAFASYAETVCENSEYATITFTGLTQPNYWVCFDSTVSIQSCNDELHEYHPINGQITIDVCPDSEHKLKPERCDSNDYFETSTYKATLFRVEFDIGSQIAQVVIQPVLFFPTTTLTPDSGIGTSTSLTVRISGSRRPADNSNRNDYQISFKGEAGTADPPNNEECKTVDPSSHTTSWTHGPIDAGEYRIDVTDCDNHDVVFERIWFTVRADGTGEITRQENDPEGIGSRRSLVGRNPCEGGTCPTAIGNIPTDVTGFSSAFLSIAIGVAGGIALILMVIGSIRVLTSSGDPKGVGAGRDMIIAAVAGLLFLIFSVLILRLIGVSILSGIIPGTT